jgi:hypothetical protein
MVLSTIVGNIRRPITYLIQGNIATFINSLKTNVHDSLTQLLTIHTLYSLYDSCLDRDHLLPRSEHLLSNLKVLLFMCYLVI